MTETTPSLKTAPRGRRRRLGAVLGVVALAVAAVAVYFAASHTSTPTKKTATSPARAAGPAPAAATAGANLASNRVDAAGISADGWATRDAAVSLAGGKLGLLTIRGSVPNIHGQRVAVLVDGRKLTAQTLQPGSLALRLLVPQSSRNRRIELRFARATKLAPPDDRSAAARLTSISVQPVRSAPSALKLPTALSNPAVVTAGIAADGWIERRASVVLAGGPPAELALRAAVPRGAHGASQHLTVLVNGRPVVDEAAAPGTLRVRAPLDESAGVRRIDLEWATAARLSAADPRVVAARLLAIAVHPLRGPAALRIPAGLHKAQTVFSGIYDDGWAQKDVRVVLAGGPAATLTVSASTATPSQQVDVLVDGHRLATAGLAAGRDTLRVPVPASGHARLVELRFARADRIAPNDARLGAALLRRLAVVPIGRAAPAVVRIPADLGRPGLVHGGIYADGWAQQGATLAIAGGPATMLSIEAQTLAPGQRITVVVDGHRLGSAPLPRGNDLVKVHVAAHAGPRILELRFARIAPIAANDPRPAATLLRRVSLGQTASPAAPELSARLTGANEVPQVSGGGSGTLTATLAGQSLDWHLRVAGLSGPVVAAVVRVGAPGQTGPRLFYLCSPCSDDASGTVHLSPSQAQAIRSGGTYVNVGTSQHLYGEVRGQLTAR